MLKLRKKLTSATAVLLLLSNLCVPAFAEENIFEKTTVTVLDVDPIGKTNQDTSIYGYDLEDNMIENNPYISNITISGTDINIVGYIDDP